jgi:hypothetical protein
VRSPLLGLGIEGHRICCTPERRIEARSPQNQTGDELRPCRLIPPRLGLTLDIGDTQPHLQRYATPTSRLSRSSASTTGPLKCSLAWLSHSPSVPGPGAGTMWVSTSVPTPARAAV